MSNGITDGFALLAVAAVLDGYGNELGCAFAVANDGLCQFARHCDHRRAQFGVAGSIRCREIHARLPAGDEDKRVVGRGIAINGNAVEGFVGGFLDQRIKQRLRHPGIRGNETEHRRHVWPDHAGALAHAGYRHGLAIDRQAPRSGLGHGIGGHDRMCGSIPSIGHKAIPARGQTSDEALDRQGFEDHAGRERQYLASAHFQQASDSLACCLSRLHALLARTGIGDAGIDDQRADPFTAGQVSATQMHRRSAKTVFREHASDRAAGVESNQGQIAPVQLTYTGLGRPQANTGDGIELFGSGSGVIDGHGGSPMQIKGMNEKNKTRAYTAACKKPATGEAASFPSSPSDQTSKIRRVSSSMPYHNQTKQRRSERPAASSTCRDTACTFYPSHKDTDRCGRFSVPSAGASTLRLRLRRPRAAPLRSPHDDTGRSAPRQFAAA